MKTRIATWTLTILAATLALTAGAAALEPQDSDYRQEPPSRGYTGEELFLGIMLGHGELAERLPELWEEPVNPHWDAAATRVDRGLALDALDREIAYAKSVGDRDEILVLEGVRRRVSEYGLVEQPDETPFGFEVLLETLRGRDPEFFPRFAREVQSGDHLRIQAALRDARAQLTELWLAEGARVFADPTLHPSRFWIRWTTIYKKRAIYKRTAVWKNRWIFGWFATANTLDDALEEEIVVHAIATRFALSDS